MIFLIVYGVFGFWTSQFSFVIGLCVMMVIVYPISTFSYDQTSQWNLYAMTLPITRRQLVAARYMVIFICLLLLVVMQVLLSFVAVNLEDGPQSFSEYALTFAITDSVAMILLSISFGALYRFGPEKGRLVTLVVSFLPAVIIVLFAKALPFSWMHRFTSWFSSTELLHNNSFLWILAGAFFLFSLCIVGISYLYSCRVMERTEF